VRNSVTKAKNGTGDAKGRDGDRDRDCWSERERKGEIKTDYIVYSRWHSERRKFNELCSRKRDK